VVAIYKEMKLHDIGDTLWNRIFFSASVCVAHKILQKDSSHFYFKYSSILILCYQCIKLVMVIHGLVILKAAILLNNGNILAILIQK
jgi:hypothetical protein